MAAGTRQWRKVCALVRLERRPCHLCKGVIDYTRTHRDRTGRVDPLAFSGDHLLPYNRGGPDTYANCGASHLKCNAARHDDPLPAMANPRSDSW